MLTYTYLEKGKFALIEKPKPILLHERDAIVKVTLASICSSDLHIKLGSVPRAVPGISVGHEMVGVVEEVGRAVTNVKPGDRVTVNVETFCGECFFCKNGYTIEYHHCSSDPNSLYVVLIKELNIALLDGTSPHIVDPINPGAVDEILNMGDALDMDVLSKNKKEIISLN